MRLTKKSNKLGYCLRHSSISANKCWNKLGQLEDIEDELGIDLIKVCLFALNGGYYKGESPSATPTHIAKEDIKTNFAFEQFDCYEGDLQLYFKDYGKTWALTKEKLL